MSIIHERTSQHIIDQHNAAVKRYNNTGLGFETYPEVHKYVYTPAKSLPAETSYSYRKMLREAEEGRLFREELEQMNRLERTQVKKKHFFRKLFSFPF